MRKGRIFSADLKDLTQKMQEYAGDDAFKAAGASLDGSNAALLPSSNAFVLRQSKAFMDALGVEKVKATIDKYLSCYRLAPNWKSKQDAVAPIPDAEAVGSIDKVLATITAGQKLLELPNAKTVLHTRGAEVAHVGTEMSCL
eukprot:8143294-Alexandrium_andersonii.AAC.1